MKNLALAVVACFATQAAMADYSSVQHNLVDGVSDFAYDAGAGQISITNATDLLTLNDPVALPGTVTNTSFTMTTTFSAWSIVDSTHVQATTTGGTIDLSFDYDGSPHFLSGNVAGMIFTADVSLLGSGFVSVDGEGLWDMISYDLPGSNVWPDGGGLSSWDSLTFVFNVPSTWDWDMDLANPDLPESGSSDSLYSLFPDDRAAPEPASALLLLAGGLALVRRRR